MVSFPNAKINLGLHIAGRRPDGFHELETIFFPIPFYDVLELIPLPAGERNQFHPTGLPIPGNSVNNLCLRAYELMKEIAPSLPPLQIYLHKTIPTGAGLGGGSSNGAFMLKMINQQFKLECPEKKLEELALQLGSDCPFFLYNKPCLARGRGEVLEPLDIDLKGYHLVLINPGIEIPTAWAFHEFQHQGSNDRSGLQFSGDINVWKDGLKNDLEEVVFRQYPELEKIKSDLYQKGALYAAMSGSGSTIFGIFNEDVKDTSFPSHYLVKRMSL